MHAALPAGPSAPRALQMAAWLARPLWFAQQCRARYGDMFTVKVEARSWVMLSDPAAIREVFTAPADLMRAGDANEILRPMLGPSSVLLLDGAEHMHQRKLMMAERSDAFLALPGGIGTFEELFEMWSWRQLGYHDKPLGLLNVAGYYDALLAFLQQSKNDGFMSDAQTALLEVGTEANALTQRLADLSRLATGPDDYRLI